MNVPTLVMLAALAGAVGMAGCGRRTEPPAMPTAEVKAIAATIWAPFPARIGDAQGVRRHPATLRNCRGR
jgi:hypothetical protein